MNSKVSGILEKVANDVRRGDHSRALKRISDGIEKMPDDLALYEEAIEVSLEAGEPLTAVGFVKQARRRLKPQADAIWEFASKRVASFNDPVLCKYLLDEAIKKRDLFSADSVVHNLEEHTASELLTRTRTKMRTLSNSSGGAHMADLLNHAFAEAVLCIRTGHPTEGIRGLVNIMDKKPTERETVKRFMSMLVNRRGDVGPFKYGMGCAMLVTAQLDEAIPMFVEAARLSPDMIKDGVTRLEMAKANPRAPVQDINFAIAEMQLAGGDARDAAEQMRECLRHNPKHAGRILELLRPMIDGGRDMASLDYLFAEAALAAGQPDAALKRWREVYRKRERRSELLAWLDNKARERSLPAAGLLYYGELALEQGLAGRAVEVLREALVNSPSDSRVIEGMLFPHVSDPSVKRLLDEIGRDTSSADAAGGLEIEHYGGNDFSLDGQAAPHEEETEPTAAASADDKYRFQEREITFEETPNDRPAATSEPTSPSDEISPALPGRPTSADVSDPTTTPGEPPATRVEAAALEAEDEPGGDATPRPASDTDLTSVAEPRQTELDFDTFHYEFARGQADRSRMLEAIEKGLSLGRLAEIKKMLDFEPQNVSEDNKRKYYLAEYYLAVEQPLSALVTLKTVNLNSLDREERREFLLKIAYCYQCMSRFEAAHSTYLRILSENPGLHEVEELARMNYQKFMEEVAGGAPTLEKITKL